MNQYLDLQRAILERGMKRLDRTRVGTMSIFGFQMRFDLTRGFPLLTTKRLHLRSIIHEILWFLTGDTNVRYLNENGVRIWDDTAGEDGEVGPIYGAQWRSWRAADGSGIDQISQVVDEIKAHPESRRLVVSAWNVADLPEMRLPPCHPMFQFHVAEGALSCLLYQRSADVFIGVPFDIASYALLTMMVAQVCGLRPGELVHVLGDAHLYMPHLDKARLQLTREPRPLPRMRLNPRVESIFDFKYSDFTLEGYDPHPHIKAAKVIVV